MLSIRADKGSVNTPELLTSVRWKRGPCCLPRSVGGGVMRGRHKTGAGSPCVQAALIGLQETFLGEDEGAGLGVSPGSRWVLASSWDDPGSVPSLSVCV